MTTETFNNLIKTLPETGTKFKGTITRLNGVIYGVSGLIYNDKQKGGFYLCHNNSNLKGSEASNKQGCSYSWMVGSANHKRIDIEIEHINNEYSIF